MSGIVTTVEERWTVKAGAVSVSGSGSSADEVTVEVNEPGSGFGMNETPDKHARATLPWQTIRALMAVLDARVRHD